MKYSEKEAVSGFRLTFQSSVKYLSSKITFHNNNFNIYDVSQQQNILYISARKYVEYSSLVCLTWLWINFSSVDSSRLCIQNPERQKQGLEIDRWDEPSSATYWDAGLDVKNT